jgi:pyruvate/2-oxoglutarate dehydrogenase complex dihydrolipoamide dehydrogenase (E3) component
MPNEIKTYDLVIIGGGPAGIVGAATAKAYRKTVAVVDNHHELGGTGVNTGTVPSKTLRETALALSGIKARQLIGMDFSLKQEATVADFLRHEQHVKEGFNTMIPEVSMVGATEETLMKAGVDYVVGRANYRDNGRGRIIGDLDGFLKLLFRREDMKLLGVHIIGEQATEIVHIGLVALLAGSTADVFVEACFNAPTLGALYKSATIDAMLKATGAEASLSALAEAG